jgi:hypothetical protein
VEIPEGLDLGEEWLVIRKLQGRRVKQFWVAWLLGLAHWQTVCTLTFESLVGPEVAERTVKRWLQRVAPGVLAVVAYERQQRGAVHAHVLVACCLDLVSAEGLWNQMAGFCRLEYIRSEECVVTYALKHCVKGLEVEIYGVSAALC